MMIFDTVLPIWQAVHERFYQVVESLSDQELKLVVGPSSSVASLIRHSAEVEIIFADWFFNQKMPSSTQTEESEDTVAQLLETLKASNQHLVDAMRLLPEEAWHQSVDSQMGASTPLEAIGRLIYHTGIHAGQISLTRKNQPA